MPTICAGRQLGFKNPIGDPDRPRLLDSITQQTMMSNLGSEFTSLGQRGTDVRAVRRQRQGKDKGTGF